MDKVLPLANILLAAGASAVYFWHGDLRHGFYWLGAVILTSAVTF